MANQPTDVTEAELAVLEQLWQMEEASARDLAEKLYHDNQSAQKTVKKLLERLEAKDCVTRDHSGPIQLFRATIERDDLIDRRLRALAESLCDGSLTPILTQLVRSKTFLRKDRESLRALINELDKSGKPRNKQNENDETIRKIRNEASHAHPSGIHF